MKLLIDGLIAGGIGALASGVYIEFGLGYSLICGGCITLALGLAALVR